ncbi:MAG: hypothetical protein MRK00_16365 [Nitrosomonas sp.]|nr:hypothetical protein [Nitrosomonas sp.]
MEITVTWQMVAWLIGLVSAWTGFLIGIIKLLIGGMIRNLDRRIVVSADECNAKWAQVDASLKRTDADLRRLIAQLPIEYQRREDSIRETTAMNAKLDRIYEILVTWKEQEK